ncbi:hypothetical protein SAMN05660282_01081 [Corynebacterium spheniscorum]|uniref:Uncharacterized protein n=1 Tax=Corynebacterium spheniscorum TaxID=185761 RepID=A0A1I2SCI6_9CORY|nr:hypothetical protein SAMN05660282_01081 [Corynebacterium spheniscorum]
MLMIVTVMIMVMVMVVVRFPGVLMGRGICVIHATQATLPCSLLQAY